MGLTKAVIEFTFGNDVLKMKVDNSSHRQECPYPLIKFWIDLEVKVPLGVIFLTMFYLGMWSKYLDLTAARLFIAMMKESYSRTVFAPIRDYSTAIQSFQPILSTNSFNQFFQSVISNN